MADSIGRGDCSVLARDSVCTLGKVSGFISDTNTLTLRFFTTDFFFIGGIKTASGSGFFGSRVTPDSGKTAGAERGISSIW